MRNINWDNEKFLGPTSPYAMMMWRRPDDIPVPWKFNPEMKTVQENDPNVPEEFSNPVKYPLPHTGFLWLQRKGSLISRKAART